MTYVAPPLLLHYLPILTEITSISNTIESHCSNFELNGTKHWGSNNNTILQMTTNFITLQPQYLKVGKPNVIEEIGKISPDEC